MALWTIKASYDEESRSWYSVEGDVPGLITSGATLEELQKRASLIAPELLELNAHEIAPESRQGPHQLRIVVDYESTVPLAA